MIQRYTLEYSPLRIVSKGVLTVALSDLKQSHCFQTPRFDRHQLECWLQIRSCGSSAEFCYESQQDLPPVVLSLGLHYEGGLGLRRLRSTPFGDPCQ